MAEEFVEKIRYEADISDVQAKLKTLGADHGDLDATTSQTTSKMGGRWDKMKSQIDGFSGGIKNLNVAMLGVAGAAAIFGPKLLSAGAELEALGKKSATVFDGAALAQVQAWASGVAGSLGMTRDQLVGTTAGIADLLKPMGFATADAAKMSTGLVDLSGALSAWTGGTRTAKEVSEILTKSLLGERDGLKELGISISEADVQARLAANGADKLTGAALEQAKAIATQQLIMEKSTDAQKAWNNGSMDSIKNQNESKAAMANLGETFTRLLYPGIMAVLPLFQRLAEGLVSVAGWFGKVFGFIADNREVFIALAAGVGVFVAALETIMIVAKLQAAFAAFSAVLAANPIILTVAAISALVAAVVLAYQKVDWFRDGVQTALAVVKIGFDGVVQAGGWLVDKLQAIWSKTEGLRGFLTGGFSLAWGAVKLQIDLLTTAGGWLFDKLQAIWDKTEGLRSFLSGAFSLGIGIARQAFEDFAAPIKWVIEQLGKVYDAAKDAYDMVRQALGQDVAVSLINAVPAGVITSGSKSGSPRNRHNGGVVDGLPSGEVVTKLLVGETVRTRSQEAALQGAGTVNIYGLSVHTNDSPRRFFDEGLWRVAG